jgi:hypothetical protein
MTADMKSLQEEHRTRAVEIRRTNNRSFGERSWIERDKYSVQFRSVQVQTDDC